MQLSTRIINSEHLKNQKLSQHSEFLPHNFKSNNI